jgi:hypothetical protein
MSKQTLADQKDPNHYQFGLGLLLGFFAGTTTYFMFNTQQGKDLRATLKEKWDEAIAAIPSIQHLKIGDLEVSELVGTILGTRKPRQTSIKSALNIQESSRSLLRSKTRKPEKFKGM